MSVFRFKNFDIHQDENVQKISTDSMILGALVEGKKAKNILDVGTGTGVIALMLAQKFPTSKVIGLDIDSHAVKTANLNFENSPYANRIEAVEMNFLDFQSPVLFDKIVANPPYFDTKMYPENVQRALARHEIGMSLFELIEHAKNLLTRNGQLWIILPANRTVELLHRGLSLFLVKRIKIYGKPNNHVRDVLVFCKNPIMASEESLVIRYKNGNYTDLYKNLTKDFHFNQL
ncbi:MAG: methyltransferase [Brumimicrobium sp.]